MTYVEKIHRVAFEFDSPLPKGETKLWIRFRGSLMHNMCGFYRSTYEDDMGREKYVDGYSVRVFIHCLNVDEGG